MAMQARDACRKMPVTVTADATVAEAAEAMNSQAVGAVVVVDGARPIGIVTDRDLALRVLARRLPVEARVDAVMSSDLVTIEATADLREAVRLFGEHPIRRLLVVDEGRMVGMLTVDDLMMDVVSDMVALVRPVTGQVIFGYPEPGPAAEQS